MMGALALTSVVALSGCVRGCTSSRPPIHLNPSMDNQPKVRPQTASTFFYDGASMRQPVPGTVPIGGLKEDAAFFTGKGADGQFVATIPVTVRKNDALLERGRQRYVIYCQPCHDARGDGKGILFQRGNVPTASVHQDRIVKYPDGQMFDVITNGTGLMPAYRWPIPPADRWAIVAYVRDLERKRLASAADAPASAEATAGKPAGASKRNRRDEPQTADPARSRRRPRDVRRDSEDRLGLREPQRVPGAQPGSFRDRRRHAPRRGTGRPGGRGGQTGPGQALRGGASTGDFPSSEAAWPSGWSRSFTCCSRRSSWPSRSSRSSSRRSATRPEIVRYDRLAYEFTKLLSVSFSLTATFGACADVHAHHSVSEVHELPDERVLANLPPVRPALLLRSLLPLHLLLRLGEVPSPGASWPGARPQRRRHGHHVDRQCLAHVHDVSERGLGQRGAPLRLGRGLQLHLDADQRPSNHRERRLRRIDRRRLRGLQVPPGGNRRGARALRLDGIHRQLRRHQRLPPAPLRRLLAREGDLRLLADARAHDDGRGVLVALHHSGGPDREPVPRGQLLPLARDGTGRRARSRSRRSSSTSSSRSCSASWSGRRPGRSSRRSPRSGRWEDRRTRFWASSVSCRRRTPP